TRHRQGEQEEKQLEDLHHRTVTDDEAPYRYLKPSIARCVAAWTIIPVAARNARRPSGPRRKAEKSSRLVPASASIWAGFMGFMPAVHATIAPPPRIG